MEENFFYPAKRPSGEARTDCRAWRAISDLSDPSERLMEISRILLVGMFDARANLAWGEA